MRRRTLFGSTLLFGLSVATYVQADALPPPGRESGSIVSIDTAQSVIVLRLGRRERRARFTSLTRVRLGGAAAAVTDLRPGMLVTVRFAASETGREGTTLVSIDAEGF
jgi:hypothetical protein